MNLSQGTLVFSGMIASDPYQGGATWAILQYLLGLKSLGHRVYLIEPIQASALRPSGTSLEDSVNAAYFRQVLREFGLEESAALLLAGTRQTVGLPYERLESLAAETDLLLNVSGMLTDERLLEKMPLRAYLDLDPGFVQLWHAVEGIDMRFQGHHRFVTIGMALGEPGCPIPTCGLDWIKTLQPIELSYWPVAQEIKTDAFTSVGHWRGYGSIQYNGVHYGQRAHSLREIITLPRHTSSQITLALAIHPDEKNDLEALRANGWHLVDPVLVAGTPRSYRHFIQGSRGELSVAKSGYVHARCGWFSDRSICYLASGRPVVAQNTCFQPYVPVGNGLFAYSTVEEAAEGIARVNEDYPLHAHAARDLAESLFSSRVVLPRLLAQLGLL